MGLKKIISADWVFPPNEPPLKQGGLLLENDLLLARGRAEALEAQAPDAERFHLGGRALIPGLINAHTHLELATLDRIAAKEGFVGWVRELLAKKETLTDEAIVEGAKKTARAMQATGTAYVADIASSCLTMAPLKKAGMPATVFREFLGLQPEALSAFQEAEASFDMKGREGVRVLPACHAPFSTSPGLFREVDAWARTNDAPCSMHLAESEDETELIEHGRGAFLSLIKDRGIDERLLPEPGATPVAYVDRLGCLGPHTLAVHLVQATDKDLALIRNRDVHPCLCPSSNVHLTGKLPQVQAMLDLGLSPCLGTDSLASGDSCNLFREMEILLDAGVASEAVLAMGTCNAAKALKLDEGFGRFDTGTTPAVCSLPVTGEGDAVPLEKALRAGVHGKAQWVLLPGANPLVDNCKREEGTS